MSTQLSTKLAQDDIIAERCASAPTIDASINSEDVFVDDNADDAEPVIFSEVLLYAQFYIYRAACDSICKTICEFFDTNEIIHAKKCIWDTYHKSLGKIKWRRCIDASDKNFKDIMDALYKLDKEGDI